MDRSTISKWFKDAFPVSGKLCSPNKVPIKKFRPNNIMKAYDYLLILSQIAQDRIVYGDEKLLKGSELYNGKTRCNMFTGKVPQCFTHSDFRNAYCIVGFCTTNRNKFSVYFDIFQSIMDGDEFSIILEGAIASGFILEGAC